MFWIQRFIFGALLASFSLNAFAEKAEVVLYKSGCRSYFIADGPHGFYLLE